MASRRYSQHGYATLPSVRPASTSTWNGRTALGLGAAVTAAVVAAVFFSGWGREPVGITGPGGVVEPVSAASGQAVDPAAPVSLMDSALAKVQDAAQALSGQTPSGLSSQPLNGDSFEQVSPLLGRAEAELIQIYQLISQGEHRQALAQADALVRDHPNFQLAHLVHGDLLSLQMRPVSQLGDVPDTKARVAIEQLNVLRDESRRRLRLLANVDALTQVLGRRGFTEQAHNEIQRCMRYQHPLSLLIVTDMLLTGFDSKYLNTLYVDKNLKYHGLIQAFSRTNRVLNGSKPYGNILDFRQQQDSVDAAIALFSGENATEEERKIWLVDKAPVVIEKLDAAVQKLADFMQTQGLPCAPHFVPALARSPQQREQ